MFSDKKEQYSIEQLPDLIEILSNKKFEKLDLKAKRIISELESTIDEYVSACDDLEHLDAEPDTELYINTNTIKHQKSLYAKSLKKIADSLSFESTTSNIFEKYKGYLDSINSFISETLKTNSSFKMAFMAYAKHLSRFKKIFSSIERLTANLSQELSKNSRTHEEYVIAKDKVQKLLDTDNELGKLSNVIETAHEHDPGAHEVDSIKESILTKESEISSLNSEINSMSAHLALLLMPLERPARKYDHISHTSLVSMLEHPDMIKKENHAEFLKMLSELKAMINENSIEIKNKTDALSQISVIEQINIPSELVRLNLLTDSRTKAQDELDKLAMSLSKINELVEKEKKHTEHIVLNNAKISELRDIKEKMKKDLESTIESYYGARVIIK
jgi:hypothetical protein